MLHHILKSLDLNENDQKVYLHLLNRPECKPSEISKHCGLPRTTIQSILVRLERIGLVMKIGKDSFLRYTSVHPENILGIIRNEKDHLLSKYTKLEKDLQSIMPQLLSHLDQTKSVPQIKFFKGAEGARTVLFDTLNQPNEIKDFANIDSMFEVIPDVNQDYVNAREKTSIKKRSLLLDTPFARSVYETGNYSPQSHQGYKWIPSNLYPFTIEMNIYQGKISYLTYSKQQLVGMIIENEHIFEMHDSMWNLLWDLLPISQGKASLQVE